MSYRKKLIEVALPLDAINKASAKEKSIRQGHPSTFHLWWSRKPLAACRAVLFASLVDDPSEHPDEFPTEEEQERERRRLFQLIEELVKWENSNNQDTLARVRAEIRKVTGDKPPVLLAESILFLSLVEVNMRYIRCSYWCLERAFSKFCLNNIIYKEVMVVKLM